MVELSAAVPAPRIEGAVGPDRDHVRMSGFDGGVELAFGDVVDVGGRHAPVHDRAVLEQPHREEVAADLDEVVARGDRRLSVGVAAPGLDFTARGGGRKLAHTAEQNAELSLQRASQTCPPPTGFHHWIMREAMQKEIRSNHGGSAVRHVHAALSARSRRAPSQWCPPPWPRRPRRSSRGPAGRRSVSAGRQSPSGAGMVAPSKSLPRATCSMPMRSTM